MLVELTREFILQGRSGDHGWNKAQLASIGVGWPLKAGWIDNAIGRKVTQESAQRFLQLKGHTRANKASEKIIAILESLFEPERKRALHAVAERFGLEIHALSDTSRVTVKQ